MKPTYIENYTIGDKLDVLKNEINWVNEQAARGECFMSSIERQYQYINNGPIYTSIDFHPLVEEIMIKINKEFNYNLNVCFLNYYIDNTKALGWHADDSPNINQKEPIAVVSFGQSRDIWWKPNEFKGLVPDEYKQLLGDGSLFLMPAGMQDTHKHKIPKGDRIMTARISLTYRSWK